MIQDVLIGLVAIVACIAAIGGWYWLIIARPQLRDERRADLLRAPRPHAVRNERIRAARDRLADPWQAARDAYQRAAQGRSGPQEADRQRQLAARIRAYYAEADATVRLALAAAGWPEGEGVIVR
jgi:hypothetical protein